MNTSKRIENRKGVALITVLVVVALLTILVVAFMSTSRTEYRSSTSYADTQRAKLVAKGAVAHAVEILRNNIPEPAGIDQSVETATAMNWAINPGRLTLIDEQNNEDTVDLHTGAADVDPADTLEPDVHSVDLNEPIPGKVDSDDQPVPTITYALDGNGVSDRDEPLPQMRVKWVNILKDPSKPASAENPIVSRHAFWMDDESGKINFNTSMGKPDPADDPNFEKQLALKMMPPLFSGGEGSTVAVAQEYNKKGQPIAKKPRQFGLGSSRSVNLDVLLDNPDDLDRDQLMAQTTLRGFSRYPEAVLDFISITDPKERSKWWHENRYNLTSYSRSPEFNVFGIPRLMTTWAPLSLEGGPNYQSPFVFNDGTGPSTTGERIDGVLHLSGLLGTLARNMGKARVGETTDGEDGPIITSRAVVSRYQLEMLRQYFYRKFPGYEGTFFEKLGGDSVAEREAAQIALNILAMSRYGTAPIAYDHDTKTTRNARIKGFPQALVEQLASVNYFPNSQQAVDLTPERYYWWYEEGKGFLADPPEELKDNPNAVTATPMLPVHPGPFITEVRMLFRPEQIPPKNPKDPSEEKKYRLSIELQAEYYLPGVMGTVDLKYFPFKMDYIQIEGDGNPLLDLGSKGTSRNWDDSFYRNRRGIKNAERLITGLGAFRAQAPNNLKIHPHVEGIPGRNRNIVKQPLLTQRGSLPVYLAKTANKVARQEADAKEFTEDDSPTFTVKFRGGMGVKSHYARAQRNPYDESYPLQMIPLGITDEDVLEAEIEIDMTNPVGHSVSWQINDPRLSSQKEQWIADVQDDLSAGTPRALNEGVGEDDANEPDEDSAEKSKFRYIQRGYNLINGQDIARGDEMDSHSRVLSKGFWSFVHTGVQSGVPWRTMALNADPIGYTSGTTSGPPDWVLMDLMGTTQPIQHDQRKINATLPDEFSTISYMHSTSGAINLNTKTYPDDSPYFKAPARTKPLEGVFKNLRDDADVESLLEEIHSFQDSELFRYAGDLALVDGYDGGAATEWEKETLLRNMISCLTTKSNTYGVWGAGQVVKKARGNEKWGEFEDGDTVRAEKRFFAIVERYIWPGKDGVPGNAHVDENGELDRISVQNQDIPLDDETIRDRLFQLPGSPPFVKGGVGRLHIDTKGTYPEYDGPQKVEMNHFASAALGQVVWNQSSLEEAYNPPQAVTKYRVVYFKYLDE